MNVILLSGGSGKRLWPLSNEVRSKQFLKIYRGKDGARESMIQRVYRQILSVDPAARVTVATSKSQASILRNQLGDGVSLSVEPCRRDTFPAIALAAAYQHDVLGIPAEAAVCVCPVDHAVEPGYYRAVEALGRQALKGEADLVLLGIRPTGPSSQYGYILPRGAAPADGSEICPGALRDTPDAEKARGGFPADEADALRDTPDAENVRGGFPADGTDAPTVRVVEAFREKPDAETARAYLRRGALWNAGVFAFRLAYVLETARRLLGTADYAALLRRYAGLEKISFDYAVAEKAEKIQVMRYDGPWLDIGSWSTLTRTMTEKTVGRVILGEGCEDTHVINDLNIPMLCLGLKDMTVAASPDGILVAAKEAADRIRPYAESMDQAVMVTEKTWGVFRVLDEGEGSLTARLSMKAGSRMSCHSHRLRDEVWTVVSGRGTAWLDGQEREVGPGDTVLLPAGCRHRMTARTDLVMIEIQTGAEIRRDDKEKYPEEGAE